MSKRPFEEGDVVFLTSCPSVRMTVEGFCRPPEPYVAPWAAQALASSVVMPARKVERPVNCVWFKGSDEAGWSGPFRETFEEGSLRKVEQ